MRFLQYSMLLFTKLFMITFIQQMHIIKAFKQISFKDISGLEVFKCIQLDLQLWWLYFAIKIWIIWNIYPGTDSNVFSFFVTNQSLNIVSRENRKIYIAFVLTFHMKLKESFKPDKILIKIRYNYMVFLHLRKSSVL